MRLNIGRSKNQKYYYVQKTVYIDGKEKSLIVEKLGSHTSPLRGFLIQTHDAPRKAVFAPFWVHL